MQVDDQPATTHSALKADFYRAKQLLYYGANLGRGEHKLTMRLEATSERSQMLMVDYVDVFTTPSLGGR